MLFCCVGKTLGKGSDVYINCIDDSGEVSWSKAYGTTMWEIPYDFKVVNDYYVSLSSQSDTTITNTYFLKCRLPDVFKCNVKDVKIKSVTIDFDFIEPVNYYSKETEADFVNLEIIEEKIIGVIDLCK